MLQKCRTCPRSAGLSLPHDLNLHLNATPIERLSSDARPDFLCCPVCVEGHSGQQRHIPHLPPPS